VINQRYLAAVNSILGATIATLSPTTPRNDLVATFLTGITGLNNAGTGFIGEVMRLNTNIAPVAQGSQNELGVVGAVLGLNGNTGDIAGFPNGRRPGDDVVDIALDVMMGALCASQFSGAGFNLCVSGFSAPIAGILLTDGSPVKDKNYNAVFPYLTTPTPGSYLDGAAGNVVTNATFCYPASQHGRCAICPTAGNSTTGGSCSSAGRVGGAILDLLSFLF